MKYVSCPIISIRAVTDTTKLLEVAFSYWFDQKGAEAIKIVKINVSIMCVAVK